MGLLPKDAELLPPYDDRIFKVMLTSPKAKPTLILVSSEIIQQTVHDVIVRNNELPVDSADEKAEVFDVNCLIDKDYQADIEMQGSRMKEKRESDHANLRARSVYNVCDLHAAQNSRGKQYDKLTRTYQVMFCGYTVFSNRAEYLNPFSIRHDTDNGLLHDAIKVLFIELTKLDNIIKKSVNEMTDMERFCIFLHYADKPDYRDLVNRVIESKEGLAVAGEVLMNISKDERERAIFRSRRMALADRESDMATVMYNQSIIFAKKLLIRNRPIDEIVEDTGLTHEEIEKLRDVE